VWAHVFIGMNVMCIFVSIFCIIKMKTLAHFFVESARHSAFLTHDLYVVVNSLFI
jgi:hypothetical protein